MVKFFAFPAYAHLDHMLSDFRGETASILFENYSTVT